MVAAKKPAKKDEAAEAKKPKAAPKKKEKSAFTRGKRKEAIARASVKKGSGRVTVNRYSIDTISNKYIRAMVYEPIVLSGAVAKELDIEVSVYGGGQMGQAEAARQAIARGIVEFASDPELKARMLEYDRHLLSEDARRVEPKKYKGPKARARFQKSYR
jgi:small subunit ribosomal protein S9